MRRFLPFLSLITFSLGFAAGIPESELSRGDATKRFEAIRGVSYDLSLDLTASETFRGQATLRFEHVVKKPAPVRIDFREGTVEKVSLNEKALGKDAFTYAGNFIVVKAVPPGAARIDVTYAHPYSKSGDGFYRFKDPEDGREYVYTNFEPYDANLAFPLFDQPDLKAKYRLKVTVPVAWIVTSAALPAEVKANGNAKDWIFPEVGPFSTYVFSVIGGEFAVWEDAHRGRPLRVLARKSLARWVKPQDWFQAVKKGMDYFEGFFATPYPYAKYDQVVVPDFTAGAMENVANVTFNEKFLPRRAPTLKEKAGMYGTILHELAHMWFGDLVTMKWWNGLWLNESFATFMAYLAIEQFPELPNPWINFTGTTKQWAYWQDELVTTHPIEVPVAHTGEAFTNFDGITYGKGASVLRQLYHALGDDRFRQGMALYFKTFAEKNTEIEDFIGSLARASGTDLKDWSKLWLQTSQMNHVAVAHACEGGKISSAELRQTYPKGYATLRPHRAVLALVYAQGSTYAIGKTVPLKYDAARTPLPELKGLDCPAFVFPNAGDYDYAKVLLDERSLAFLKDHLTDIGDDLLRAMLWQTLWDSVEEGRLALNEYVAVLQKHLPREKQGQIVEDQRHLATQVPYYLEAKGRKDLLAGLADFALAQWKAADDADLRRFYSDLFVNYVASDAQRRALRDMLGRKEFQRLPIDQDKRWAIILKLSAMGDAQAQALAEQEAKTDRSSRGQENAVVAKVLVPDAASKRKFLGEVYDPARKLSERVAMAKALLPVSQQALWPDLKTDIVETYRKHASENEPRLHRQFIGDAFGRACDADTIAVGEGMERYSPSETQKRAWAVRKQELEKCARILAQLR